MRILLGKKKKEEKKSTKNNNFIFPICIFLLTTVAPPNLPNVFSFVTFTKCYNYISLYYLPLQFKVKISHTPHVLEGGAFIKRCSQLNAPS